MIRRTLAAFMMMMVGQSSAIGHDIPNARVDRSIQATLSPGLLRVDYEVSLSELTLTQDLRQLVGELSGADRQGWLEQYGKVVGPLNAKGLLATVSGEEVELKSAGFDLTIEGHPRYTFHFKAKLQPTGRLVLIDTNYLASEGTSRLALRSAGGVEVHGDSLPTEVSQIPIRPTWQLSDAEERRTRRLLVDYATSIAPMAGDQPFEPTSRPVLPSASAGLSGLLDRVGNRAWPTLIAAAFLIGAAHAIQPGHGKTMVAAASMGPGSSPIRGVWLGLSTAMAHLASVALIALGLWATRSARAGEIHLVMARLAGFVIAAVGFWKLGRHLAGLGEHGDSEIPLGRSSRGIIPLAIAGGIVPCWDAVALILLSEAIGRLPLGLALLTAFSLGMASVLVIVGGAAGRFRSSIHGRANGGRWERRFGLVGGLVLAAIGLAMLGN